MKLSIFATAFGLLIASQASADAYMYNREAMNPYRKITSIFEESKIIGSGEIRLWLNTDKMEFACDLSRSEVIASGHTFGELQLLAASSAKDVVFECFTTKTGEQRIKVKVFFLPNFQWTTR